MSSQSLYRKWRSQTFAEVIGQEHVTRTLLNALRTSRVAHAYLFCGPRGTGKTSTARLLAKAMNCRNNGGHGEPCNECDLCVSITEGRCLDVIEIDAASNRGIDDIRDLREKVNFAPGEANFKLYIIDEVHQLSGDAFNALLKTLEEPPAHTIFVLASTEAHKIPATILSRCQRFDFRRIGVAEIVGRLQHICEAEDIEAETAALELVARGATGSLRDAESVLDQLRAYVDGTITVSDVEALIGTGGSVAVRDLAGFLFQRELAGGLRLINRLADEGTDMRQLARDIVEFLRGLLLVKSDAVPAAAGRADAATAELAAAISLEDIMRALKIFSRVDPAVRGLVQPQLPLEMAFADYVLGLDGAVGEAGQPVAAAMERQPVAARPGVGGPAPRPARPPVVEAPKPAAAREPVVEPAPPPATPSGSSVTEAPAAAAVPVERVRESWPTVVEAVGRLDRKVQALLRDCAGPDRMEDATVVLAFSHGFHREQVEQQKNRAVVEAAISGVVGQQCLVRCELATRQAKQRQTSVMEDPLVKEALSQGGRIKGLKITTSETENTGP